MKDKIISFPEEILDALQEYKEKTGIPATDYIRSCVCRKMIQDGLIMIRTKYIDVNKEKVNNGKKVNAPPQEILFCDSEKCQVVEPLAKGGC